MDIRAGRAYAVLLIASGELEICCRKVTQVARNGAPLRNRADYSYDSRSGKLKVSFKGATTLELPGTIGLLAPASAR